MAYRIVVTGACGFVGRPTITALRRDYPNAHIVAFDSLPYVHDADEPVTVVTGDVTKLGDVVTAVLNADAVIHTLSTDLHSADELRLHAVNVEGTKNVIEACKQCKVQRLVYVSDARVVFSGRHSFGTTEDAIIPVQHPDKYVATKAQAEKLVLNASRGALATCALRPSAVFGKGDASFLPRFIDAPKVIVGRGINVWDLTYVENLAHACVCALKKLEPDSIVAGQAYFITNCEPVPLWKFMGRLLGGLEYTPPRRCIPFFVCYIVACIVETLLFLTRAFCRPQRMPVLTRSNVRLLVTNRTYCCDKAMNHFDYKPIVSLDEAVERTIESFKPKRKDE